MGRLYCCVPKCTSCSGTNIKLHRIPKHKRKEYADLIKRPNWVPTDNSRICEKHFAPNQYSIKFGHRFFPKHQRILKDTAMPNIFPHLNQSNETTFNESLEVREKVESTLKDHQYFGEPEKIKIVVENPTKVVNADNLVVIDSNIEEVKVELESSDQTFAH